VAPEGCGDVRRFRAVVEYDGTELCGFQYQEGRRTVQGELERAILERSDCEVRIEGAGRTDSGVHGRGQVISFSCSTRIPGDRMALALNSALPLDVSVLSAEEAGEGFHARYSASSRVYLYTILNRRTPSAMWRRYSAFQPVRLDVDRMQVAAASLLGERDFAAFANELDDERPTWRDLMVCHPFRRGDFVFVKVEANAFLRGMVRNLVGTLMDVGIGKRDPASLLETLASRDRRQAGPTAPAEGLCLWRVRYGERKSYAGRKERDRE